MGITCQQLISTATVQLLEHSDSALLDAEVLLSHVLQQSRAWIMAYQDEKISAEQANQFKTLVTRREQGTPIAYLTGQQEFWSLPLKVNQHVLIPRPETELLVEQALELLPNDSTANIADLGTGSGAIALAIAYERPEAEITGVDQSEPALEVARENAANLRLSNTRFVVGNWLQPLSTGRIDMIVSNPPYIASADPHLQQGDVRFEPKTALVSGIDGLQDIFQIISQAPDYLSDNGYILLEHGFTQGKAVRRLLEQRGFGSVETATDLSGHPRVTQGQWQRN